MGKLEKAELDEALNLKNVENSGQIASSNSPDQR